jgi:hypothetical protein
MLAPLQQNHFWRTNQLLKINSNTVDMMIRKHENIVAIDSKDLFNEIAEYEEYLIREATANGALAEQDADNEYTREIRRLGSLLADYESIYMTFKQLKFKSPLAVGIEKELAKRSLKQRLKQRRRVVM